MACLSEMLKDLTSDEVSLEALSHAAEAAERYDDMVSIMKALVENKLADVKPLSSDQRNLLSLAYKNVVGSKRSSWRLLNDDVQFEDKNLVDQYKKQVEEELKTVCNGVLDILDRIQEQNQKRMEDNKDDKGVTEGQIFYLKMIGDYYRYLTEVFSENEDYKTKCGNNYQKAMNLAEEHLSATHPTRLGLALNYSVCYFEILKQPEKACELAKSAFDEAIDKLDSLNDDSYRDSTLIMQLLRDNLTIWTNNGTEQDENETQK